MKIITKASIVKNVPDRYRDTYPYYTWRDGNNTKHRDVYNELLKAKTETDIIKIVGTGWTNNICDECEKDKDVLLELVNIPHECIYRVCEDCISKMKDLFSMMGVEV